MFNPILASKFISSRINEAEQQGVMLSLNTDLAELYFAEPEMEGKRMSPMFSPQHFDLLPSNAFWIEGRDQDGRLVHVQAMRLCHTGSSSLAELLPQQLARAFGNSFDRANGNICCPAASELRGRIAYHGDMWLSKSLRGKSLGITLGQIGLAACFAYWQPDYVYGFAEADVASKGVLFQQGYWNCEPLNLEWKLCYPWLLQEDWLVWMNQKRLSYMVQIEHQKIGKEQRRHLCNQTAPGIHSADRKLVSAVRSA